MTVESSLTLAGLEARLVPLGLTVMGGVAAEGDETLPTGTRTLVMLGPREPGFWAGFTASEEWQDGQPDPMDRWSRRVIGRLACDLGAKALFPFGGPPWQPFFQWALRTGRAWQSPVRLLVHDSHGLWVSYRGALALRAALEVPKATQSPCESCADKPCLSACPAGALGADGYDVPRCHGWLSRPEGRTCLSGGCLVRRACPASQGHARMAQQSAYHMGQFHR